MKSEEEVKEPKKKRSAIVKFFRRLFLVFIVFILLLVGLVFLTQVPAVQDWGSRQIASFLSRKLNTEVSVDGFRIKWTDEFEIRNLLIRDLEQDSMIYAGSLSANLNNPVRGFIEGKVEVDALSLNDALINIKFKKEDWYNNLNQVFKGQKVPADSIERTLTTDSLTRTNQQAQIFYLADLQLNNVRVRNYNEILGKEEQFYVGYGELVNSQFDPAELVLTTEELRVRDFAVNIRNFEYDTARYYEVYYPPFGDTTDEDFPINLIATTIDLSDGELELHNYRKSPTKTTPEDQLDWTHLSLSDISILGDSFYMKDWTFGGKLHQMKALSSSGFSLVDARADRITVTEEQADLENFILQSSMSTIQGDLKFIYDEYPDFRNFEDSVRFDFESRNSDLGVDDLITLSPGLKNNPFFESNSHELIHIDGRILGYVNNLKGRSLDLRLGRQFVVNGLIDVRDFTDPDKTRINFNLNRLTTNMRTIGKLVPNLNLPDQWNKLGEINLKGEFNGLLKDFIASGQLNTDIGEAVFDMNLNFADGVQNAVYGGKLNLNEFDLGEWSGNPEFGYVNLQTSITEGRGLVDSLASAQIAAKIVSFQFKGYDYQNANFEGLLKDQLINGTFSIVDENIDLEFIGKIQIGDNPHIDVTGGFDHLDLKALRLVNKDLVLSTDFNIDIRDLDPDRFTGSLLITDLNLGRTVDSLTHIDSVFVSSDFRPDSNRVFNVTSDIVTVEAIGEFKILSLPNYFINYFHKFNPKIAGKLNMKEKPGLEPANFDWNVSINDSRDLLNYFAPGVDTIKNAEAEGWMKGENGFFIKGNIPYLEIDKLSFENINVYANAEGAYTNIVASHDGMKTGKINLAPMTVFADLEKDTVLYVFNEVDLKSYVDQINMEGKLFVHEDQWQTQLYNSSLQLFGDAWSISEDNYIRFGQKKVVVRDLDLFAGNQRIEVETINDDKGLEVQLKELPLDQLNEIINYNRIQFSGLLSGHIRTNSLKDLSDLEVDVHSDQLEINGDQFGQLDLLVHNEGRDKPFLVDINLENGPQKLSGHAKVTDVSSSGGNIEAKLDIDEFPSRIMEYFILNGLSNTNGKFSGEISASGPVTDPVIDGYIDVPESSFTVDILGTTYYLEAQRVSVNSELIDATGVELTDRYGNRATVTGGLTHHNLANLGFDAVLRSDEILILDTDKKDNDLYYGTCFADITARFSGTTQQPVINIEAENKDNSTFIINNDSEKRSTGLDFIVFDFDTVETARTLKDVMTGVDLTIDMTVNRGVQLRIIMDEATRDIMEAKGTGDLIFKYSPAGEISLFGDYVIEYGEYLFTYSVGGLVPVNKPFVIQNGSRLTWTDDPFNADVDIRAEYTVLASPYNLISDRTTSSITEEAQQKTDVDLELILTGPMLHPEINFNITLPELTGQLKNAVDTELARIRTDPTEMQSQAASLIVFREFAASEIDGGGASVAAVASTISEWLSNQVSYYLTGLVSTLVNDLEFIDDVQFDVGYQLPSNEFASVGEVRTSELGVSTTVIMFDRRLEASVRGDYVNSQDAAGGNQSNYFNTDVEFDYILTEDRRWRLRAYSKQDQFFNDRRTRTGLGITWRREYDNLEEFKAAVKDIHRRNKSDKSSNEAKLR